MSHLTTTCTAMIPRLVETDGWTQNCHNQQSFDNDDPIDPQDGGQSEVQFDRLISGAKTYQTEIMSPQSEHQNYTKSQEESKAIRSTGTTMFRTAQAQAENHSSRECLEMG